MPYLAAPLSLMAFISTPILRLLSLWIGETSGYGASDSETFRRRMFVSGLVMAFAGIVLQFIAGIMTV